MKHTGISPGNRVSVGMERGPDTAARCRVRAIVAVLGTLYLCHLVIGVSGGAMAQAAAPGGTLGGRVVDSGSGGPVAGAVVTLEGAVAGLLIDPAGGAALVGARVAVTNESGTYLFRDVVPGLYRLRIERLGYRGTALEVDFRRPVEALVSVALEVEAVELEPLRVTRRAASLFQRAANSAREPDEARRTTERTRQDYFLSPDSRVLTAADVMDGVTLGEGDVFRALQRFPGVGTRDDYTAELWIRGAPWTHTRVTFDGVPLFNPLHAVGILSAITPEVLGAVFFHSGVRPAGVAEGVAGVVDLRSRPGGGDGAVRGATDLSMASAKLVLDQHVEGRGSWVVAARRSHLGVLSGGLDWLGLETDEMPYTFADVAGRLDLELGGRTRLEASGLWEEDRLTGDVTGLLERTEAHWGNRVGRVTVRREIGAVTISQTVSASRYRARTDERLLRVREPLHAWTEPASHNQVLYRQIAGELAPGAGEVGGPWAMGYDLAWSRGSYGGPMPRYHAVRPDTVVMLRLRPELVVGGLWAEARFAVGERLAVNPGLRLETGDRVANAAVVRPAPRLAARFAVSADQSISVAAGRSWQYMQAIGLAGPSIHPAFHASHFWVWADAGSPAVRSDILSLGSERWLGGGWLGSATTYVRRARGVSVPDTVVGPVGLRRPLSGENLARGAEVNLRRLGAHWSAALGYGYGVSDMKVGTLRFPGTADRRHLIDAMLGVRVSPGLRLSGAYSAMSGAPFTRAYSRSPQDCSAFGFGCNGPDGSQVEAANAQRTPAYRSLDLSLHWTRPVGRLEFGAYAQIRNLLGRDNASTYAGSLPIGVRPGSAAGGEPVGAAPADGCSAQRTGGTSRERGQVCRVAAQPAPSGQTLLFQDRFEPGLPRLPLVGLRVTF